LHRKRVTTPAAGRFGVGKLVGVHACELGIEDCALGLPERGGRELDREFRVLFR